MKKVRMKIIWAVILCLLFVIGCGGGGGDSQTVIAEPNLSLSAQSNNFGGVVLNNYADYEFRITNDGTYNGLVINGISSPLPPFSITSNTCTPGTSLAKGASCSFIVRFLPTVKGEFSSTISVTSNDPPIRTITLTGIGQELNVWINQITYSGPCPVRDITIDVTATNPYGVLVPNPLLKANFKLWHNNVELLPADFSDPQRINPDSVSVVLALDLSASLNDKNSDIKLATAGNLDTGGIIEGFIDRLRGAPTTDEAIICKFKDAYQFSNSGSFLPASTGKPALKTYVRGTTESTLPAGTALYEAVYASITKAAEGISGQKKVVIVLSDGVVDPQEEEVCGTDPDPTKNKCTQQKVIDHAKANGVPIFTIFYVDTGFYPDASPATLQQLAEGTGGQYFNSGSGDSTVLAGIFKQIMNVFGEKYVITYRPLANCSGTQIPVKVLVTSGDTPALTGSDTKKIDLP